MGCKVKPHTIPPQSSLFQFLFSGEGTELQGQQCGPSHGGWECDPKPPLVVLTLASEPPMNCAVHCRLVTGPHRTQTLWLVLVFDMAVLQGHPDAVVCSLVTTGQEALPQS